MFSLYCNSILKDISLKKNIDIMNTSSFIRIFLKKPRGFPGLDLANTRLSSGNLGVFSDFFQNSNEKWSKVNKKWLLECKNTFSIRLCKQKLISEL